MTRAVNLKTNMSSPSPPSPTTDITKQTNMIYIPVNASTCLLSLSENTTPAICHVAVKTNLTQFIL